MIADRKKLPEFPSDLGAGWFLGKCGFSVTSAGFLEYSSCTDIRVCIIPDPYTGKLEACPYVINTPNETLINVMPYGRVHNALVQSRYDHDRST
jgi:hypothetical protein